MKLRHKVFLKCNDIVEHLYTFHTMAYTPVVSTVHYYLAGSGQGPL